MRLILAVVLVSSVVLVACGDNRAPEEAPDAAPLCSPPERPVPPGPLMDVASYLPANCVPGGLVDLPARWFVRNPDDNFTYGYPRFEGSCSEGFRQANWSTEDEDDSDGFTFQTWSDGTRFVNRFHAVFMGFEFASGLAACLLPNGDLAAGYLRYDSDQGARVFPATGGRFGPKAETPATGLTLVGELGLRPDGFPIEGYNLVIDDDIAYVVGPWGLDLIDVSAPAAPRHLSALDGYWNDIKVVRRGGRTVAFVSPIYDELTLAIDVTDPAAPAIVLELPEYSHSVFVREDGARTLLYLATYTSQVPVYDVSNPLQPMRLGAAAVTGASDGVHDIFADGDLIYVNYTTAGLVAVDVAAGLGAPVERGRLPTPYSHASWAATVGGRRLVIHGDEGMTPDGGALMRVLDGDPASPTFLTELGRYRTRAEVGIHNIFIEGTKAYVAYYQDGIRVVDLADPTQPREIAHYNTWSHETAPGQPFEGALGLRHVGDLIYVADSLRGLVILRETP